MRSGDGHTSSDNDVTTASQSEQPNVVGYTQFPDKYKVNVSFLNINITAFSRNAACMRSCVLCECVLVVYGVGLHSSSEN